MAYIPPNKRHSRDKGRPSPTPESFVPLFKRNPSLKSPDSKIVRIGGIAYADHAISRWFAVGLSDKNNFPSYIHLEPTSLENVEGRLGEKPLVLVHSLETEGNNEMRENCLRSPWEIIADNVQQDLLSSFEILKSKMDNHGLEKVKPVLVARFCKFLFHGSPSVRLGSVGKNQVDETILRRLHRSIYYNIPSSYMENVINEVVPKIGINVENEKDVYHVKLYDNTRPDSMISCKCSVKADKKLQLYKVELNLLRQMVTDISCLDKNLDLRLMLYFRRTLTALTDDEMNSLQDLINSAVLDSEMKGGLRWPLGKESSRNRYSVVSVSHTITKAYGSPSLMLKVRHANRFNFRTGAGESTREIHLKLRGILSELKQGAQTDSVSNMLKDNLRLIWEQFLSCESFFT